MLQTPIPIQTASEAVRQARTVRRALMLALGGVVLAMASLGAEAAGLFPQAMVPALAGLALALAGGGMAWRAAAFPEIAAVSADAWSPPPGACPAVEADRLPDATLPAEAGSQLRGLFEDGPIGIAIVADDGQVVESNPAFRSLTGGTAEQPSDSGSLAALVRIPDSGALGECLASPAAASVEVAVGQGEDRSGRLFLGPVEQGRRVIHLIDTTRQKKLEVQFAQSQRMLAVGKLAGGIAHDFNNLLTAMTGFCDLLLLRHTPGDPSFADIMQIKHNANRAANLVRQLLAFSRQQTLQPRVLTLADVIADLSSLLRRLLGAGIELRVAHGADVCPVRVDRVQLEQVLINLAVNARDAMDGNGRLEIRSRDVQPSQVGDPPRQPPLPAARWVLIEVLDTGQGIPAEHLDRIFEPFFTTKPVGEGTGLGLSTVYGIVKQTGGYIYAENTSSGALFSVYLPAHAGEAGEAADAAAQNRSDLTGQGAILLVEDEDPVRLFAARALRSKGYQVTEARTGEAAMALLEAAAEPFDLLVTDVVMPEMDGPTLIEHVRGTWPDMRVICISGYAESTFRDKLSEFEDLHFLSKPFSLQQLAGKVKEVMTG